MIDYDPLEASAYRELAGIFLRTGRLEDALKAVNRSLQLERTAEDHLLLAKIHMGQGRLEEARAELTSALSLGPPTPEAELLREELDSKTLSRP